MKLSEKAKMGLECCINGECNSKRKTCPYRKASDCASAALIDALAYIRELEARVAEHEKPLEPLPEVQIYGDEPVWLEIKAEFDEPRIVDISLSFVNPAERAEITFMGQSRRAHLRIDHYGKTWRCWPRRPTDEERKAAEWDE